MSLVGKKSRSFVSALGNISVYALVIFITLCVLIIFSNLTFLVQSSQESGLSSESARRRCPDSQIIRHDHRVSEKIQ